MFAATLLACGPSVAEPLALDGSTSETETPRSVSATASAAVDAGDEAVSSPPRAVAVEAVDDGATSSAPLVLARAQGRAIAVLADEDAQQLTWIDLDEGHSVFSLPLPGRPAHVIIDPAGRILVAVRDADVVVEAQVSCRATPSGCSPELVEVARIETPREPIALSLADDAKTLLVACGRARTLLAHPLRRGGRSFELGVGPEPRGVAVDADRRHAFVAHALGSRVSVVDLATQTVTTERALHWRDDVVMDGEVVANLPRFAVQGHAVAVVEGGAVIPMVLAYPGQPAGDSSGYGASIFGLEPYFPHEPALVSMARDGTDALIRVRHETVAVDRARRRARRRRYGSGRPPCLLPRSAALDPTGERLLVGCTDTGQIIEYAVDDRPLSKSESRRWTVGGGVQAIRIDPTTRRAWVWSQFDRTVVPIDLTSREDIGIGRAIVVAASTEVPAPQGRRLFHQPVASDGRSCATCHIDGRDDGLVWRSPSGMVATPILAGRIVGGEPFGWHGEQPELQGHMRRTFARLRAQPAEPETLAALEQFLRTMPTFALASTGLTEQQRRGRAVFNDVETGCAACHTDAGLSVDGASHRVGTGRAVDTPSLRGVGNTAPYMHDGRYQTLRELLVASDEKMGSVSHLEAEALADLIAYLRAL